MEFLQNKQKFIICQQQKTQLQNVNFYKSKTQKDQMIQRVALNFGSLTSIRIMSRVCQFILKTYLIRNLLDKQIVGHMVQLDLIITISLHFIKSCLKPAYQKVSDPQKIQRNILSGMNLLNYGLMSTLLLVCIVCGSQLYSYENHAKQQRLLNLNLAIIVYGFAAIFEALFEKYNVKNVLQYNYMRIAVIQMCSFLPKTLFIFIASQFGLFQKLGILVFAIGYLIYTALMFLISFLNNQSKYRTLLNVKISKGPNQQGQVQSYQIDEKTKQSAKQFLKISIFKLIIQESQKVILVTLDVSSISSIYTLINNLGSIVVRFIFAPLQQVVYNYFSRGQQTQSVKTLTLLVRSITLFSCLSLTFGYNFSQAFLGFLYGQRWVQPDSIRALQIFTVFLSFIGINGIMQSFLFAKAGKDFQSYKYYSLIPALTSILLSFYFINVLNFGAGSFFLANSFSMGIRIIISWNLQIKKHISLQQFIKQIKPSTLFLLSLVFTFLLGNPSIPYFGISRFNGYFKDMLLGGFLFMINISVIAYQNRQLIIPKIMNTIKKIKKTQ